MLQIGGIVFVFATVFGGYVFGGGKFDVILHALPFEGTQILGAAVGAMLIGSTMTGLKKTIGDMDVREPLWNIWGYFATHGLGYHEYLQLAEDLGATPLFCINVGMSHKEVVPLDRMNECCLLYTSDAADE